MYEYEVRANGLRGGHSIEHKIIPRLPYYVIITSKYMFLGV